MSQQRHDDPTSADDKRSPDSSCEQEHQQEARRKNLVKKEERRQHRRTGGLVLVYTGAGKGKTTAALGLAVRALGQRCSVSIMQFIKGRWITGERRFFTALSRPENAEQQGLGSVRWETMGEGFSWVTPDRSVHREAALLAWQTVATWLTDETIDLVVLDELNVVVGHGHLDEGVVESALRDRPPAQHVVITGRGAGDRICAVADTVIRVSADKHHYTQGFAAQRGIEF